MPNETDLINCRTLTRQTDLHCSDFRREPTTSQSTVLPKLTIELVDQTISIGDGGSDSSLETGHLGLQKRALLRHLLVVDDDLLRSEQGWFDLEIRNDQPCIDNILTRSIANENLQYFV